MRIPWLILVILRFGLAVSYGGVSTYRDQHSGTGGKTIDVRVHGSDHVTKPALGTSIVLCALGLPIVLFGLGARRGWARRGPQALAIPPAIREHLVALVHTRWSGKDPEPVIAALPDAMEPGKVSTLVSGGPYGWLIMARLDEQDGRIALEALEDSRMAGPDHYRVWDDGTVEPLEHERIEYVLPKGATPEDEERIRAEYVEHNRRVQRHLRERGFS